MQVRSLGREDLLEKGTATHSRVLAWRIPWTEEPGGLRSTKLQSQTIPKQLSAHAGCEVNRWRKLWRIPLLMANTGRRSGSTVGAKCQLERDHDKRARKVQP